MKILDALKTAALFLIAAGLFAMSYVIYDVMGKHGRYVPVTYEEDQIVVMDTHTGHVWSKSFELKESTDLQTPDPINGKIQSFPRKLIVKADQ